MVHAFVLLTTAAGTAEKLVPLISEVDAVTEAHVVAGESDVIVEIETEEVFDVLSTITREIQPLDGVGRTRTYVALA